MITQSDHDAQVMRTVEAVVKSFGGSVVFTMQDEGYKASINFPKTVSKAQEIACAEKVARVIERMGGEIV